jgi:hypothetical protein
MVRSRPVCSEPFRFDGISTTVVVFIRRTMQPIDVNVPRFNQAMVALLIGVAFVFDLPRLVALTFLVLAASLILGPSGALFTQLYVRLLRPRLQPGGPTEFEDPRPPRFAQLLGTIFLGAATGALAFDLRAVGWTLTLIVTALATLAATTRICVGCLIYQKAFER